MINNPVAYVFSSLFVIIAHGAMLVNVFMNGNYDPFSGAVDYRLARNYS